MSVNRGVQFRVGVGTRARSKTQESHPGTWGKGHRDNDTQPVLPGSPLTTWQASGFDVNKEHSGAQRI